MQLAARSDFSIGESILSIDKLVEEAAKLGHRFVGLVDTMTLNGMVDFSNKAKKKDIKPIIGCTLRVYKHATEKIKGGKDNPHYNLKAYVLNEDGLKSLFALLTLANDPAHFYYHARVSLDEVISTLDPAGVAISTGDFFNVFHQPDHLGICTRLVGHFEHVFIEFVPIGTPLFDTLNTYAAKTWRALPLTKPMVTYPALYEQGKDKAADVHRVITMNAKVTDPWVPKPFVRDFALDSKTNMVERSKRLVDEKILTLDELKEALRGNLKLAEAVEFEFKKKSPSLPKMAADEFATLRQRVVKGWKKRFDAPVLGHQPTVIELQRDYMPRLKYELGVIEKMGFAGYFLLAQEIVVWSKEQGIIVGPGRGSVGGSLVAYLIGITDVDPIRFNLLFERFINPDRIDLPDADLDFMSTRRHEVIEQIEKQFGKENVAGISNYAVLGAASCIRDVSRVHGLEPWDYACSKSVEKVHGVSLTLEESAQSVPEIDKFKNERPIIWENATALEGVMRNLGRHAAGVVVSGEPVVNRGVVETRSGGQVVNWDKRIVEDWGLIKMDILGLSTLDMLGLAAKYIKERKGIDINYLELPLDDENVLKAFGEGDTVGVFQFESGGMRNLLKQMALGSKLTFEDLVAATALFRPGPLDAGLCDEYIQIKQGTRMPSYEHPNMKAALEPTLGVIIYQEQVMQICRDVAGFTMTEADHVRKAMGKKDKEKMASYREKFIEGAKAVSGMGEYQAGSLWDKIEVFAGYAFNRSHSVEYTVISWWCMWLKVTHPGEFYAASLTIADDEEKQQPLVIDARKAGIVVLPPDINLASDRIEVIDATPAPKLMAPFQAIKGISEASAREIVKLREKAGGRFANEAEMGIWVTKEGLGRKAGPSVRAKLASVGAFHSTDGGLEPLHPDRLRDRLALMPGYTCDAMKADRGVASDKATLTKIVRMVTDIKACDGCSLKDAQHPPPRMGKTPRFMMVFDCPSFKEGRAGKMFEGESAAFVTAALKDAGLSPNDGYYTSVVKAVKPKEQKTLANDQINGCSKWLDMELDTLKPPVIVAMGSAAIKRFAPGTKGNPSDLIGKVIYEPKLNASIIFGLNPAQVIFDPSKTTLLQTIAQRIAELIT